MSGQSAVVDIPPGLKLSQAIRGLQEQISQITWSPDGAMFASLSDDGTIRLWNAKSGQLYRTLETGLITGYSMTWSPDASTFALGGLNKVILLDRETGQLRLELEGHLDVVNSVAWAPNGR